MWMMWLGTLALAAQGQVAEVGSDGLSDDDTDLRLIDAEAPASPMVVGGRDVNPGEWPDTSLVWLGNSMCTGVLIHPQWVLTAGHCAIDSDPYRVILGMTSFSELERGRAPEGVYEVDAKRAFVHPAYRNKQLGHDIALVKLEEPVTDVQPRVIASDCVLAEDLVEGAKVTIVGWGSTRVDGSGGGYELQSGKTFVETPDCSAKRVDGMITGCDPDAAPAGELGAGGNGVDACYGDSGGPLYLETERGTWLVGITSRAYLGVPWDEPCGHGGVYTRPDSVLSWIEDTIGETLPRAVCTVPPTANAEPIAVHPGGKRKVHVDVVDTDGEAWSATLLTAPAHGTVVIDGDDIRFEAAPDYEGTDSFVLEIVDDGSPAWPEADPGRTQVTVDVQIARGLAGCGCSNTSGIAGGWLALLSLWGLRRRRA